MPGTVDQALGSNGVDLGLLTGPQTVSFTTTSAAAINTRIVVTVGYFSGNGFCSSVSVDGVAAVKEFGVNQVDVVNPGYVAELWSIPAPGGVAAGATISATWSTLFTAGQMGGAFLAAISLAGMDLAVGGGTQAASSFTTTSSAGALKAGTAIATGDGVAIAMISSAVGGGAIAGTLSTGTQFATYNDTTDQDLYDAGYLVLTGSQSVTFAGTFTPTGGGTVQAGATVVYSSAGVFTPHRMPLGA